MSEHEEMLTGGNTAESVVRVGATVRKPVTKATLGVHSLLRHLYAAGVQASPRALGADDQGRQVLEFVPGAMWHERPRSLMDLQRVGAIVRALHEAAASFEPPGDAQWDTRPEPNRREFLCHNDLAPWNLVCGADRWVFIDWDAAAPSTRLWDLSWAAISFSGFKPECDLDVAAAAMHALLRGYGLDCAHYRDLIGLMVTRAREECSFIVEGAKAQQQPWDRLHREEHHLYWGPVSAYIDRHADALHRMLMRLEAPAPM